MTQTSDRAELTDWGGDRGQTWVQLQESLDRMLEPLMPPLLETIDARAGDRILEVGCGCGALSLELARRVGEAGRITGVDVSGPMLGHARSRGEAAGLDIRWLEADASAHDFELESYAKVVSRFGVMFFGDPVTAFANLRSALEPGGRLAFICWRAMHENASPRAMTELAARVVEVPPEPPGYEPGPFAFADRDFVRKILLDAGFGSPVIEPVDTTLGAVGESVEEITAFFTRVGPMSRFLKKADATTRRALLAALDDWIAREVVTGSFRPDAACWLVSATA